MSIEANSAAAVRSPKKMSRETWVVEFEFRLYTLAVKHFQTGILGSSHA
jgi:hypothetical protein